MSSALLALGRSESHEARALVRHSISTHGKSFALSSLALPLGLRDETAAVYAFCRRADDLIDTPQQDKPTSVIERLERELDAIYAGLTQPDPALSAFQAVVHKYQIPRHYPSELLAGMRMDVEQMQYATLPELLVYCYRVAGTVGLMMCHVLGVSNVVALRHAAQLGMAMQLTNVCRDVAEDWRRGRLYLPSQVVRGFGRFEVPPTGQELPLQALPALATTTRFLLNWADALYEAGEAGIVYLPFRAALAVRTARLVYADIGLVLKTRGADPLAPRAVVSASRKAALATRALVTTTLEPRPRFARAQLTTILGAEDVLCL